MKAAIAQLSLKYATGLSTGVSRFILMREIDPIISRVAEIMQTP